MNKRGFVHVVVMDGLIIIAILGIIAAIAIPQYINYRNNKQAESHAYQSYQAAQAYFRSDPKHQPTQKDLEKFGYQNSPDILITIEGGKEDLVIRTQHTKGRKEYRVNEKGEISH